MNVFKEAGKAATKIRHLTDKRDAAISRASGSYGAAVMQLLREAGPDVAKALVHQGLVHEGVANHAFSYSDGPGGVHVLFVDDDGANTKGMLPPAPIETP